MATLTLRGTTASTTNATSYISSSFTPAAGELLVVLVVATATNAIVSTMTSSQGLSLASVAVGDGLPTAAVDAGYLFISTATASAVAQTVTFDCTGDAATGCVIWVFGATGLTGGGSAALVQNTGSAKAFIAGATPSTNVWGVATSIDNPTILVAANLSNPAALTPPAGWTEVSDTGYNTPTTGVECVIRNSGYASTASIVWGGTSVTAGGAWAVELNGTPVVIPFIGGGYYG